MTKRLFLGALAVSTVMNTTLTPSYANSEGAGTVIGAILGGIIGNEMGNGNGAATGLGIILGALIGNEIGRNLDESDRVELRDAQDRAMRGRLNERVRWDGSRRGSRTGARGEFWATHEGRHVRSGEMCREYRSVIVVGRRTEDRSGIACSRRDGSWVEVRREDVYWNGQHVSTHEETTVVNRGPAPRARQPRHDRDFERGGCDYSREYAGRAMSSLEDKYIRNESIYAAAAEVRNSCSAEVFDQLARHYSRDEYAYELAARITNRFQQQAMNCLVEHYIKGNNKFYAAAMVQTQCGATRVCNLAANYERSDRIYEIASRCGR